MLSVDPSQQSRGVGRILLEFAFNYAAETMGRKQMIGYAIEQRPELLGWYFKLGFKDAGERVLFPFQDRVLQENIRFVVLRLLLVGKGSGNVLGSRHRTYHNGGQSLEVSARL